MHIIVIKAIVFQKIPVPRAAIFESGFKSVLLLYWTLCYLTPTHFFQEFSLIPFEGLRTEGVVVEQVVNPTEAHWCLIGFDDCLGQ